VVLDGDLDGTQDVVRLLEPIVLGGQLIIPLEQVMDGAARVACCLK
jgi:hypothetical protein